jgi:hypothetical protein
VVFTTDHYTQVTRYTTHWVPPETNLLAKSLGYKNAKALIGKEVPEDVLQIMINIKTEYCKRKYRQRLEKKRRIEQCTEPNYNLFRLLFFTDSRSNKTVEDMLQFEVDWSLVSSRIKRYKYSTFLNLEYWRVIREQKLKDANYMCVNCQCKEDLQVHHKTYEHHGDELHHLDDLVVLCRSCHKQVHRQK